MIKVGIGCAYNCPKPNTNRAIAKNLFIILSLNYLGLNFNIF